MTCHYTPLQLSYYPVKIVIKRVFLTFSQIGTHTESESPGKYIFNNKNTINNLEGLTWAGEKSVICTLNIIQNQWIEDREYWFW